jgi:hypothetical protein
MVDSDGLIKWAPHNFATYSEEFDNAAWKKVNLASSNPIATADQGIAPDGTSTADKVDYPAISGASESSRLFQTFTSIGVTYSAGVYLKAFGAGDVGKKIIVWLFDSAPRDSQVVTLTSDWQKISLSSALTAGTSYLTISASGSDFGGENQGAVSVLVWGAHLYRSDLGGMAPVPAGERSFPSASTYVPTTSSARYLPRVGHHVYNGSAWVNEGVLAESEARTNLFGYSNFSSGWSNVDVSLILNSTTSPSGSLDAAKLRENTATDDHAIVESISGLASGSYTMSVFLKKDGRNVAAVWMFQSSTVKGILVNLNDGTFVSNLDNSNTVDLYSIESFDNDWYRVSISANMAPVQFGINISDSTNPSSYTSSRLPIYTGDGTSGIYIWGAQVEAAPTPSSYIPTAGSTVTRAAETFTIPAANLPWPTETYGPELVTNGTFDADTSGWTAINATLSVVSGAMRVTNTSAVSGTASQFVSVVSGKTYAVTFTNVAESSANFDFRVGESISSSEYLRDTTIAPSETKTYFFTPQSNDVVITVLAFNSGGIGGTYVEVDNISVRELTRYPVSIQMNGRMTYADEDSLATVVFHRWLAGSGNIIESNLATNSTRTGLVYFYQDYAGTRDQVTSSDTAYSPGILVPFNIASRHGMTFVNGAVDGVALTANTTPTNLPDLSAADLSLAYDYMGTVERFRIWGVDLGDDGIADATAPSLEPSLSLTFDSSESSFVVDDWSA